MKNPKYTFCREFNFEHSKKIFWWWRYYCDVICS